MGQHAAGAGGDCSVRVQPRRIPIPAKTMASSRRLAVTGGVPWPEMGLNRIAVCPDGTVALATGAFCYPDHRILRTTLAADGGSCSLQVWAGGEEEGFADGLGEQARFKEPCGLAALRDGSLVVADFCNRRIRLVSPAGAVSTLAGSGEEGNADGPAAAASFRYPDGVAARRDGTVLVSDSDDQTVRAIAPGAAEVRTLAGRPGEDRFADGPAAAARFRYPIGVAVLPDGGALVCDLHSHRLRLLAADGSAVRTVAGSGEQACTDGVGAAAAFYAPTSVAVDCAGTAIVPDYMPNPEYDEDAANAAKEAEEEYTTPFSFRELRWVDTATGEVTTLRGPDGGWLVVTNAGLAPGYFAQWTSLVWRPTRAAFRTLHPQAKAATRAVLLLAARTHRRQAQATPGPGPGWPQLLATLPTLPLELWHLILGLLEPHALGGGAAAL